MSVDQQSSASAHRDRLERYVGPHLARRQAGIKHPVHDFLFTYYSFRPGQLLRWHPGEMPVEYVAQRRPLIESIHTLLVATAGRSPHTGCFGLHEWAMVHGQDRTRHDLPLRLGRSGTDEVVESHRIACSHFDAYRFFTPSASPLNILRPGASDRPAYEQPGCLHANMDLYRHAFRLSPMICSDLVAECFELAWEIREVDMRAAPYDLTDYGVVPIMIETPSGKREYAEHQRAFADRAAPLRRQLITECERLLVAE